MHCPPALLLLIIFCLVQSFPDKAEASSERLINREEDPLETLAQVVSTRIALIERNVVTTVSALPNGEVSTTIMTLSSLTNTEGPIIETLGIPIQSSVATIVQTITTGSSIRPSQSSASTSPTSSTTPTESNSSFQTTPTIISATATATPSPSTVPSNPLPLGLGLGLGLGIPLVAALLVISFLLGCGRRLSGFGKHRSNDERNGFGTQISPYSAGAGWDNELGGHDKADVRAQEASHELEAERASREEDPVSRETEKKS